MPSRLQDFALLLLGVLTPLLGQALFLGVPLFSSIMLELTGLAMGAAAVGAFVMGWLGDRGRIALLAVLAFYFLDTTVGGFGLLVSIEPGFFDAVDQGLPVREVIAVLGASAVIVVLFYLLWMIRAHAVPILSAVFAVTLFATFASYATGRGEARGQAAGAVPRSEAPLIVHLVLDGHSAPEALPRDFPGGDEVYDELRAFYRDFGFRLYGRVYSTSNLTKHSLTRMFNYDVGEPGTGDYLTDDGTITENRHFDELAERGYRIVVYQREEPDLCMHPAVAYCRGYDSRGGFRFAQELRADAESRAHDVLIALMLLSHPQSLFHTAADEILRDSTSTPVRAAQPFEALNVMHEVFEHVASAPPGTAIFAHLLVPHRPFALNRDCKASSAEPPVRRLAHEAYFEQTICIYRTLRKMFRRPDVIKALEGATVVIHGDHGSRIGYYDAPVDSSSDLYQLDHYATLFSIRGARQEPAYDLEVVSLQELFHRAMASREPLRAGNADGQGASRAAQALKKLPRAEGDRSP